MKRFHVLLGLMIVFSSIPTSAQPATGKHNGLWVGMYNSKTTLNTTINHVLTLDSQNMTSLFSTQASGPWPYWGNPFGACMHSDNRHVLVPVNIDARGTTIGIAAWDNTIPGISKILWKGPAQGGPIGNWSDWTMNSDGEIITIDDSSSPPSASFFDPATSTWRRQILPVSTRPGAGLPFTAYNRLNGHIYWGAYGPPTELYVSTHDFGTTTTIATGPGSQAVGRYGGCVMENGDIFIGTCCTQMYYKVKSGTSALIPGPAAVPAIAYYDLTLEHLAKPGMGMWGAVWNLPRGVHHIDPSATSPAVTTLHTGSGYTMPTSPLEVVELYANDLNTTRTGNRKWNVNINPGNGLHAGKNFVLTLSLTGVMKVPLPDGREFFLLPDQASDLAISGKLAPILTGNIGKLDSSGKATAVLDLTFLGTAANGNVVHLAAAVLDPRAPVGIAHVCQPWPFVINCR